MRDLLASDLLGGGLVWLLELDLCGRVFRFSSRSIDIIKDGSAISYPGGLADSDIDYTERLDRGTIQTSMQEVSLEVVLPIDAAQARRKGWLAGATAELSLMPVRAGAALQSWAGRHVLVTGPVSQPQIGSPSKPSGWLAFSIDGGAEEDRGRVVPPEARISAESVLTTWTITDQVERNFGTPYPIVIGRPGVYRVGGTFVSQASVTEGTPAYGVHYDTVGSVDGFSVLLIAGHHVACSGTGNEVHVRAKGEEQGYNFEPVSTYDRQGRPITIVNCPNGSGPSVDWRNADEYWVSWGTSTQTSHTAHRNPLGPRPLIGAGDVLRFLLSRSSIPIDHAAWASVAPYLNALLQVSTYYNDPGATPMAVAEQILECLPVSVRRSADGLYPIIHDHGSAGGLIPLEQGRELSRVRYLQADTRPGDIATVVSVEYTPRASEGATYLRSITVGTADPDDAATSATVHTRAGAVSHPGAAVLSISSDVIYDAASAASLARRRAREVSRIAWRTVYRVAPDLGWLPVGRAVSLTDAELHITDQPAEIVGKAWDGTEWAIDVLFFEDPARDDRS